jgi:serine/threonine protein kinase
VLDFGLAKLRDGDPAPARPAPARPAGSRIALDETMPSQPVAAPAGGLDETVAGDAATAAASPRAAAASYRTHAGQLLGTPLYMAPEQIEGALPDERSEVFSVGVLAYEVLAGKPPYTATSMDELFRQIAAAAPPPLPGYAYESENRRDPFLSLVNRGSDARPAARGDRPEGLPGILVEEVVVRGILQTKSGWIAMIGMPSGRTHTVRPGDRLMDGSVRTINAQAVVLMQEVNDPLSLEKQREVRKFLRGEVK